MKRPDLISPTLEGRAAHLVEECGEVVRAYGKLQRFGRHRFDQKTGVQYDNMADLRAEIDDLEIALKNFREMDK